MRLIGSPTSPYVRFNRILLDELNIAYDFEDSGFFATASEEQKKLVSDNNPTLRIPILIDNDTPILDSRIIAQYLLHTYDTNKTIKRPTLPEGENILTALYATIEAGILCFLSKVQDFGKDSVFIDRSYDRIHSCLTHLNQQEQLGKDFDLATMLLICTLEWFEKRDVYKWDEFSHLSKIHVQYKDRPSVIKTQIP